MFAYHSVDSLQSIAARKVGDNIHEYVARNRNAIEHLPVPLKDVILRRLTRSSFLLRGLNTKDIFLTLIHKNLLEIDLSSVETDDDLLEQLEICTELRDVRFTGSEICSPSAAGLCKFLRNKKKLRVLHLTHCHTVTDDVVKVIVENCPDLSGLVLRGCRLVTDASMDLLSTMNILMRLDFTGTMVTDRGIIKVAKGNSGDKILELRIAHCPKISFRVLAAVVENCVNIEVFEFHNCQSPCEYQGQMEVLEGTQMKRLKQLTFTVSW